MAGIGRGRRVAMSLDQIRYLLRSLWPAFLG
jgi:hypothetical protein